MDDVRRTGCRGPGTWYKRVGALVGMSEGCVIKTRFLAVAFATFATSASAHFAGFKSPGPGMHFTQGEALIVFADLFDSNNGHGFIIDGVGWPQLQVLVDGVLQTDSVTGSQTVPGSNVYDGNGNPDPIDFYRFSILGIPTGTHQVVVRGLFPPPPYSDGSTVDSAPIAIGVDPLPSGKTLLTLSGNLSGPVIWNNLIVVGNGFTVSPDTTLTITDSLVTGLGSMDTSGIDGTAVSVDIERSVFEATGAVVVQTSGNALVSGNEFRANNLLTFEASNPDAAPIITLTGASTAPKLFQGNRVAAGRVVFDSTSNWLVGGDSDAQTNILMGPRCTLYFQNGASNISVRGNYDHHNYRGGWSQGFNLSFTCNECYLASGDGVLVEHNFIRGGSWPIQDLVGEFRYNLVYGYGHTWLRSAVSGASVHHNVFAPEDAGDLNQGVWFYGGESGIAIYNNTFDGGGVEAGDFAGPTIQINGTSQVTSLRNNLVAFSRNYENSPGDPRVVGDVGTVLSADYNAFYSPDNDTRDNYNITGMDEGTTPGFATHDVSGNGAIGVTDGQLAASPFAGGRVYPLQDLVDEAAVWQRTQRLSSILAAFRARYMPSATTPIVDAGDPHDNDSQGRRADIGAIDSGGHDLDLFGKFGLLADNIFRDGFE